MRLFVKETHRVIAMQLRLGEKAAPPLPGPRETRPPLKSEHELLIVIIQQQPPFIENLLCTSNEAKSFKFMSTLNPHNNARRCVSQFVTGNQEENQFDSKTSAPTHKVVHARSRPRRDQSLCGLFTMSTAILSARAQPVHLGFRHLRMMLSPRSSCEYFFHCIHLEIV